MHINYPVAVFMHVLVFPQSEKNRDCAKFSTFKGTVMLTEKARINERLRVSKVSCKLRIPTIYSFAVIYP